MVEVWTKKNCIQCDATKWALEAKGIKYQERSLMDDLEALNGFKAQGFLSAPIVVTGSGTWSGFRPEKINLLT